MWRHRSRGGPGDAPALHVSAQRDVSWRLLSLQPTGHLWCWGIPEKCPWGLAMGGGGVYHFQISWQCLPTHIWDNFPSHPILPALVNKNFQRSNPDRNTGCSSGLCQPLTSTVLWTQTKEWTLHLVCSFLLFFSLNDVDCLLASYWMLALLFSTCLMISLHSVIAVFLPPPH